MSDWARLKLGRKSPTLRQRANTLPLGRYIKQPLPAAPASVDHAADAPIGLWGNDAYGNCTFAGLANADAISSKIEGRPCAMTRDAVIKAYLDFTDGQDVGAVETLVLAAARTLGFSLGGPSRTRLAAWVSVPVANTAARSSLIAIFGSLYLGVSLPITAQRQTTWTGPPDLRGDNQPGSWGGHCLIEAGYDDTHRKLVTWGAIQRCDEMWIRAYCDEAYVLLDEQRAEMVGVDWAALVADLQNVPSS